MKRVAEVGLRVLLLIGCHLSVNDTRGFVRVSSISTSKQKSSLSFQSFLFWTISFFTIFVCIYTHLRYSIPIHFILFSFVKICVRVLALVFWLIENQELWLKLLKNGTGRCQLSPVPISLLQLLLPLVVLLKYAALFDHVYIYM